MDDLARLLPTVVVRLAFPIEFAGGYVAAATVRGVLDTEASTANDALRATAEDLATATGLPMEAMLELDPIDWDALRAAHSKALSLAESRGCEVFWEEGARVQ